MTGDAADAAPTRGGRGPGSLVEVTGRMQVTGPDGRVGVDALPGRQGRLVLASLGASAQPVARETLADRVWGRDLPRAWERDLSTLVSKVRAACNQAGLDGSELIVSDGTTYHLLERDGLIVDIRAARRWSARLGTDLDDTDLEDVATRLLAVAERGFLPGEDAPWVDDHRAELLRAQLLALQSLAELHAHRGDSQQAARLLARVIELEPYRESAHRQLMAAQLASGDRAEAIRTYEHLRTLLAEELGLDPTAETEALYLDALRGTGRTPAPGGAGAPVPEVPPVHYARSGRVNIAYQVLGDGPVDLVVVPGWISNLEVAWEEPRFAGWLRELAQHCRLILLDKRGTGLSDPIPLDAPPPLEVRMDDVRAVMDEVGSERAVLLGFSEGGSMALLFAATHPDRTLGLVLWGTWCRQVRDETFPLGWTREQGMRRFVRPLQRRGTISPRWFAPSVAGDPEFDTWFARYARQSASPGMAIALLRANAGMDLREVLPSIRVPTLVLHRSDDVLVEVGQGRYIADHVPGARMVEFPGSDHWPWIGDSEPITAELAAFLAAATAARPHTQRVLATVLAAAGADDPDVFVSAVREHRGVPLAGTGTHLARFDGPGRAVRAGLALAAAGAQVGLHTGETTLHGETAEGPSVTTAIELAERAEVGTVLVTRTVRDLVAGDSLRFSGGPAPVEDGSGARDGGTPVLLAEGAATGS